MEIKDKAYQNLLHLLKSSVRGKLANPFSVAVSTKYVIVQRVAFLSLYFGTQFQAAVLAAVTVDVETFIHRDHP